MGAAIRSGTRVPQWLFRATGILLGFALIWLTLRVGMAFFYADSNASLAVRWAPRNAQALSAMAERTLGPDAGPARLARAQNFAMAAIRRDPTVVSAVRTLGLIVDLRGDHPRALRLMHYAQDISRRDLPTQLWLSQEAVGRNDVPSALRHYDIALNTSPESAAVIMPVLISATGDPRLIEPLADIVAHADIWRDNFLALAIAGGPSSENLVMLARALERRHVPLADGPRGALLARLLKEEKYIPARSLYDAALPKGAADRRAVVDGNFEKASRFPPFDWSLAEQPGLHAERVRAAGGKGNILSFAGENGMGGTVATQLLMLPPGNYRFSARAGNVPQSSVIARPRWQIHCAAPGSMTILNLIFPPADDRGQRFVADLRVSASGCTAQWLSLLAPGNPDLQLQQPAWVDDVEIKPIS